MKKEIDDNLGKKAIIGVILIFLNFILLIDLNDPINYYFGNFTIVIALILGVYGMYLLFPYLRNLEKYNKY